MVRNRFPGTQSFLPVLKTLQIQQLIYLYSCYPLAEGPNSGPNSSD
jgi:hypothetical protein